MPDLVLSGAEEQFKNALEHLQSEYGRLQTGRASAALVENLMVESYGSKMPLKGLANISVPEANQIAIQPWDRSQIASVEKAIRESTLGLNPQNNGLMIRLVLPPMTEERRKDVVKLVHRLAEEARISVRNHRHESMETLKKMELSEDDLHLHEKKLQEKVDRFNKLIEEAAKSKEHDIMTI